MKDHIIAFPEMWDEMWPASDNFRVQLDPEPTAVLLSGMGGSSIGGALLSALLGDLSPIPIEINRNYTVPLWASSTTLAVFTSYSGNTEETLSAFEEAGRQGAQRVSITTGGKLADRCSVENVPFHRVPAGLPPRAALPYTLVPLLHLARTVDVLNLVDDDIRETSSVLHRRGEQEAGDGGKAEGIASTLVGKIPIVYSGPGLMSAVSLRWRGQLQENAKSLAFGNVYPELNHNEIVGWQSSGSITKDVVVIELTDKDDDGPIRKRMDLTRSLLESKASDWLTIETEGSSRLARMMSTVLLGDWVSFRLAERKGVDPMPVELIDALKSGLAASRKG